MSEVSNTHDDYELYLSSHSYNDSKVSEGHWALEELEKAQDSHPNSSEESKVHVTCSRLESPAKVENCKEAHGAKFPAPESRIARVNDEEECRDGKEAHRADFPAQKRRIARVNDEEECREPEIATEDWERMKAIVAGMNKQAKLVFSLAVEKRKSKRKFKELSRFLPATDCSLGLPPNELEELRKYAVNMLFETRSALFACEDLGNTSTATLRHACMGILFDAYRIFFVLVADTEGLLKSLCPSLQIDLQTSEKLAFLANIETFPSLLQVCQYSVNSQASSTAKQEIREIYLSLLAMKEGTTPLLAQDLVPGFNYDNVKSLDEVVELVEGGKEEREREGFRERLERAKPLGKKVKPMVSSAFLEKLRRRVAQM